jgi:16S rRNA (guanine527-N7)-methyltransferase
MSDLPELLRRGLSELGIDAAPDAEERLLAFANLLARWAPRINLTAHRDAEAIARLLLLDAAALWQALPRVGSVVDLGSGAGVPGLPIAILAPGVEVLLVEARLRRHHFQKAARRELGLENVSLRHGRIESLEPEPADLVVAQAVAPPPRVLRWMIPWARPGGWLAIPGSEQAPDPLAGGGGPGGQIAEAGVLTYRVPQGVRQRSIWLGRRKDS